VHSLEFECLKKTLSALDSRVEMPESLRGGALLYKLEDVQPNVPARKKIRELVLPRRGIRTLATYAAAFALFIGMLYGVVQGRPAEVASGEIAIGGQVAELAPLQEGGGISPADGTVGVTWLGEMGQYTLYYLLQDATASDYHSEKTQMLLFIKAYGQAVSQVDIPHMTDISYFSVQGYLLTLHGTGNDTVAYTYTIDFSDSQNPIILV